MVEVEVEVKVEAEESARVMYVCKVVSGGCDVMLLDDGK